MITIESPIQENHFLHHDSKAGIADRIRIYSVYLTSLSRPHNTIHYESHPIIHSEEEEELNNPVAGT